MIKRVRRSSLACPRNGAAYLPDISALDRRGSCNRTEQENTDRRIRAQESSRYREGPTREPPSGDRRIVKQRGEVFGNAETITQRLLTRHVSPWVVTSAATADGESLIVHPDQSTDTAESASASADALLECRRRGGWILFSHGNHAGPMTIATGWSEAAPSLVRTALAVVMPKRSARRARPRGWANRRRFLL